MTTLPESPASDASAAGTADLCEDSPMIGLQVQDRDGAAVVSVRGEVDMVTTPRLQACLQDRLASSPQRLVVDLSAVSFLGSSGLAVLVECLEDARGRGTELRLVVSSREVIRPLEATGLTELFQTHQDVESALAG